MGGCLSKGKYDHCDDKETLLEVMREEKQKYKDDMEEEKNINLANVKHHFINDFEEVMGMIKSLKEVSSIGNLRGKLTMFTEYWDKNQKRDKDYTQKLNILKQYLKRG